MRRTDLPLKCDWCGKTGDGPYVVLEVSVLCGTKCYPLYREEAKQAEKLRAKAPPMKPRY